MQLTRAGSLKGRKGMGCNDLAATSRWFVLALRFHQDFLFCGMRYSGGAERALQRFRVILIANISTCASESVVRPSWREVGEVLGWSRLTDLPSTADFQMHKQRSSKFL